MHLFIEPVDVWLFRDGRPFDAGSDHRAQSLFPPFPTVIQGVVRSHHLVVKDVDLTNQDSIRQVVGTASDFKGLRMRGPFVAQKSEDRLVRYFPAPADATLRGTTLEALVPEQTPAGIECSLQTDELLYARGEPEKEESLSKWISEADLHRYLDGQPANVVAEDDLFGWENRFGIARHDTTHTAKEGALYEVQFVRPKDEPSERIRTGLSVHLEGLEGLELWPERGWLRMGGEGRGGYFHQVNELPWPEPPDPLPERFKVYFATPTYFEAGWKPRNWKAVFDGCVTLEAAALRRYQSLGGYDLGGKDHKPARRYVPAGSVYFFQCHNTARLRHGWCAVLRSMTRAFQCHSRARLRGTLIQQAITDWGAEIGLGQILIGRW